jgi:hypothetical protein
MNIQNKRNDYLPVVQSIFERTPKAVFAAIAVSFANRLDGEDALQRDGGTEDLLRAVMEEWDMLHQAGIIPQRPCAVREARK